ncbi:aspartate-alanine antiporter, partial [Undibacterium sp. CCC2.1]|nr:aspartate-alanine antiporter [Undibacterium sp. CCC2.1]
MVTWFLPMVMRWDIRQEAIKLATSISGGHAELDPGQFNAMRTVATRMYLVAPDSAAVNQTA